MKIENLFFDHPLKNIPNTKDKLSFENKPNNYCYSLAKWWSIRVGNFFVKNRIKLVS